MTKTLLQDSLNLAIGFFIGTNKNHYRHCLVVAWTGPFIVVEKVTPVDYTIHFAPDGKKKTVHSDELQMDPCNQDRPNWIKDKLARPQLQYATVSTDRVVPAQTSPKLPTSIVPPGKGTPTIVDTSSGLQGPKYREGVAKILDKSKVLVNTKLHRSNRLANKFKRVILSLMFV